MTIPSPPFLSATFAPPRLCVKSIGAAPLQCFAVGLIAALLIAAPALADPVTPAGAAANTDKPSANAAATSDWPAMLFVFMLATFIGLGVITRVSRLLHTPLMSLTNAISAIAIVGSIIIAGEEKDTISLVLGCIAVAASTTNIVSGFLITDRMLKMFKRQEK